MYMLTQFCQEERCVESPPWCCQLHVLIGWEWFIYAKKLIFITNTHAHIIVPLVDASNLCGRRLPVLLAVLPLVL